MSPRRRNSLVQVREAFAPGLDAELPGMEEALARIKDELSTSDQRHLGSVVGAGVCAVMGVLLLTPAAAGGVIGAVVGLGVGHLIGRSLRRRRRVKLEEVNLTKAYQLRLTCLLQLLRKKMHGKTPLDLFLRLIECVVTEFRPALALSLHIPTLARKVDDLVYLLRKDVCHTTLLTGVTELMQLQQSGASPAILTARLKYFFIPVMELLRHGVPGKAEMEVVLSVERLVGKKSVQELLTKYAKEVEALAEVVPMARQVPCLSPDFVKVALKVDGALHELPNESLLLRRASSQPGEFHASSYTQQVQSLVVNTVTTAYNNRPDLPAVREEEEKKSGPASILSSRRSSFRIPAPIPLLIHPTTDQLLDSSDDEAYITPLSPPDLPSVSVKDENPNTALVDLQIHPFQADFDQLLSIESEPRGSKAWQQVIDKPGVQVFKKKTDGTPICMIKAFCAIPFSKEVVFKAIWDTAIRSQWDEVFEEFRTIDVQPEFDVLYYMIKVKAM